MNAAWRVEVVPFVADIDDDYGNATATYGPPVPRYVYGWAPAGSVEVQSYRHDVKADLSVYAPADFVIDPRDRMVVGGKTYEVAGEPDDFNHGPFGWAPGVVVNLTRAEAL